MLFFIAERLQMSVVAVGRMSVREINGWLAWFTEQQRAAAAQADDAIDIKKLSKQQLRGMLKK